MTDEVLCGSSSAAPPLGDESCGEEKAGRGGACDAYWLLLS